MHSYIRFTLHAQTIGNISKKDIVNLPYVCSVEDEDSIYVQVFIDNEDISYKTFRDDIDKLGVDDGANR